MAAGPVPFQSFFTEHAPGVHRFLVGLVGPDEAEECLQEAFIAALGAYERFDGSNPRAWILTIARRKAIDSARASARRPRPAPDVAELAGSVSAEGAGRGEIWADVAELPLKQRTAIVLRFSLDLRHREIGEVIGCSEAAARRSVHEGLSRLRERRVEEAA